MKTFDLVLEILSLSGLGFILYLVIITYPELPDSIPKHWNYKGVADEWGNKVNFLTLPVLTFFIYGIFSLITMVKTNSFKLRAKVGEIKSRQIIRLGRIFKTVLIGIFLLNIYSQSMNFLGIKPIIGDLNVLIEIIVILAFSGLILSIAFKN